MEHTTHFDDCGCKSKALEAERDALRLRVAALEAVLRAFGSHMTSVVDALAGDTTVLRAMLVEAALGGVGDDQNMPLDPRAKREIAEAIAERVLKGGGR